MRTEFFAFALNEWQYKRVSFTRHYALEQAEKAAYRITSSRYKGSDYTDLSPEVIEGREAFIKWAEDCSYEINWKDQCLIYKGEKK